MAYIDKAKQLSHKNKLSNKHEAQEKKKVGSQPSSLIPPIFYLIGLCGGQCGLCFFCKRSIIVDLSTPHPLFSLLPIIFYLAQKVHFYSVARIQNDYRVFFHPCIFGQPCQRHCFLFKSRVLRFLCAHRLLNQLARADNLICMNQKKDWHVPGVQTVFTYALTKNPSSCQMIVSKYFFFLRQEKLLHQQKKIICKTDTSFKNILATVAKVFEPSCHIKKRTKR